MLAGLVRGITKESEAIRGERAKEDAAQAERDQKILAHLSTSDDPEIQALALQAMIGGGPKDKKGVRGAFFGGKQADPRMVELMAAMKQQVPRPDLAPPADPNQTKARAVNPDRPTPGLTGPAPPVATGAPPPMGPRRVFVPEEEKKRTAAQQTRQDKIDTLAQYGADTPEAVTGATLGFGLAQPHVQPPKRTPGIIVTPKGEFGGSFDEVSGKYVDGAGQVVTDVTDFRPADKIHGGSDRRDFVTTQNEAGDLTAFSEGYVREGLNAGGGRVTYPNVGRPGPYPPAAPAGLTTTIGGEVYRPDRTDPNIMHKVTNLPEQPAGVITAHMREAGQVLKKVDAGMHSPLFTLTSGPRRDAKLAELIKASGGGAFTLEQLNQIYAGKLKWDLTPTGQGAGGVGATGGGAHGPGSSAPPANPRADPFKAINPSEIRKNLDKYKTPSAGRPATGAPPPKR